MQNHPAKTFFQSWLFGQFQEEIPYRGKSWALLALDGGTAAASCLVIKMSLPLGLSWLWIPYGPLGFRGEIFEEVAGIARQQRAIFARVEPPMSWKAEDMPMLKNRWRLAPAKKRLTPDHSLILALDAPEEQLKAQMKPKGRYNIQVALRHGVRCRIFENFLAAPGPDFDAFYTILQSTAGRDKFGIHPKFFYGQFLETLGAYGMAALLLAYDRRDQVIGGVIITFFRETATYYYGGFSYEHRRLMAPYLLQWEALREAKRRGIKRYDFLGIAPDGEANHPWTGVTEFKKKFGGREVAYPPAFDIVYRPLLYRLITP